MLVTGSIKFPHLFTSSEELNFSMIVQDYLAKKSQKTDQITFIIDCMNVTNENFSIGRFRYNAPRITGWVPDTLAKAYVIRCNWLITTMYNLVSPVLPTKTQSKVTLLGRNEQENRKILEKQIDLKYLPKYLGGDREDIQKF